MELEFSHVFAAPIDRLWSVVLDPNQVGNCVPGIQSVDVISDTEYHARIKVKIAFISANFSIRAVITEMDAPHRLVAEASGQDNSIGSSVKALVGMNLTTVGDGQTELRVKAAADVFGRLGTLGLNPMRTKAERMWEQFCESLEALLSGANPDAQVAVAGTAAAPEPAAGAVARPEPARPRPAAAVRPAPRQGGLFSWFKSGNGAENFRIELDRNGTKVAISCPASHADQCLAWLDRQLEQQGSR